METIASFPVSIGPLSGDNHAADLTNESYVVEIDGIAKTEYLVFVKALKASLQLRQELPRWPRQTARRWRQDQPIVGAAAAQQKTGGHGRVRAVPLPATMFRSWHRAG